MYMFIEMYVYMYMYYMCMCIYIYKYLYIYVCTYTYKVTKELIIQLTQSYSTYGHTRLPNRMTARAGPGSTWQYTCNPFPLTVNPDLFDFKGFSCFEKVVKTDFI